MVGSLKSFGFNVYACFTFNTDDQLKLVIERQVDIDIACSVFTARKFYKSIPRLHICAPIARLTNVPKMQNSLRVDFCLEIFHPAASAVGSKIRFHSSFL